MIVKLIVKRNKLRPVIAGVRVLTINYDSDTENTIFNKGGDTLPGNIGRSTVEKFFDSVMGRRKEDVAEWQTRQLKAEQLCQNRCGFGLVGIFYLYLQLAVPAAFHFAGFGHSAAYGRRIDLYRCNMGAAIM